MKKAILLIGLFLTPLVSFFAQPAKGTPRKIDDIDRLVKSYAANFLFNGSVLVQEKGKVIFKKSYGLANIEWNIPNSPDTRFRIGSITKQFTAALILQLKDEGKLDLNAKITDYLPWYRKDTGSKITIEHLLTHSSGIPNYTSSKTLADISTNKYSLREIVERFCSGNLEFEPGTKFSYDNSGYFLLGVIIEAVTKKTYEENLSARIFGPLGMKNSGVDKPSVLSKKRAAGYEYDFDGYENSTFLDMAQSIFSAGAIYSTVEDLNLWENALFGGTLLSKDSQARMFAVHSGNYGYGLFIGKSKPEGMGREITSIGHHGGINGFSALLIRFVETGTTVVMLDNTRAEKRGNLEEISLGIFRILNDFKPGGVPKSIQVAMTEKMRFGVSGADLAAYYIGLKNDKSYDLRGAANVLNDLGYHLLLNGRVRDSLAVLKLTVEQFPDNSNAFDSYAEALAKDGQKEEAIRNYKRSLELNPGNTNAVNQLKALSQP